MLLHNIHRWRARPRAAHAESAVIALAMLVLTSGLLLAIARTVGVLVGRADVAALRRRRSSV